MDGITEIVAGIVGGIGEASQDREWLVWLDNSVKISGHGNTLFRLGPCKIYLRPGLTPPESGMRVKFTGKVFGALIADAPFGMYDATWAPLITFDIMSELRSKGESQTSVRVDSAILLAILDIATSKLPNMDQEIGLKLFGSDMPDDTLQSILWKIDPTQFGQHVIDSIAHYLDIRK